MGNEDYENVHVSKKVIEEIKGLLMQCREQGNIEWSTCVPWEPQRIVEVALAEFIEHLREDAEE